MAIQKCSKSLASNTCDVLLNTFMISSKIFLYMTQQPAVGWSAWLGFTFMSISGNYMSKVIVVFLVYKIPQNNFICLLFGLEELLPSIKVD